MTPDEREQREKQLADERERLLEQYNKEAEENRKHYEELLKKAQEGQAAERQLRDGAADLVLRRAPNFTHGLTSIIKDHRTFKLRRSQN